MVMQCIHSQEAEELGYNLKTPPSVVPPLLKASQPPHTLPPARDQGFEYMSLWRAFHKQITTDMACEQTRNTAYTQTSHM